jgi:hypothetical protein
VVNKLLLLLLLLLLQICIFELGYAGPGSVSGIA